MNITVHALKPRSIWNTGRHEKPATLCGRELKRRKREQRRHRIDENSARVTCPKCIEKLAERLDQELRLRSLQDRSAGW